MTKTEMRRENRLAQEMTVQLLALNTPDGKSAPESFKIIRTIDISVSGMQIEVNAAIPVKSKLQLRLRSKDSAKSYTLKGEVRWTYRDHIDTSCHYIGFRLQGDDQADNGDWSDYVNSRLKIMKR